MRWSGTTQYRILVGELASSDSREFERRVLPILRLAWPNAIPPPALNWLDQAGIDIMIWSDAQPFPLLVQWRWGNIGREAIISESESSDTTLRLSFRAMMKAAYKMAHLVGNSLELLSDCTIDEVISTDEQLKNITDPTGLSLNSLLVPLQNTSLHSRLRIRFAHRAYQEFFLSLFIRDNSSDFHGAELPEAIKRLLIDLETEGICDA